MCCHWMFSWRSPAIQPMAQLACSLSAILSLNWEMRNSWLDERVGDEGSTWITSGGTVLSFFSVHRSFPCPIWMTIELGWLESRLELLCYHYHLSVNLISGNSTMQSRLVYVNWPFSSQWPHRCTGQLSCPFGFVGGSPRTVSDTPMERPTPFLPTEPLDSKLILFAQPLRPYAHTWNTEDKRAPTLAYLYC